MSLEHDLARERAISSALSLRSNTRSSGSLSPALLEDLRAAQTHPGRVLICSFGEDPANLPLLSILFESVDVAHLDRGVLVFSRYQNGALASEFTKAFYNGTDPVIAGDIAGMIEKLDGHSWPTSIVLVAPEEAPRVSQEVVDVFGLPYLVVTRDAEYRYPMLRLFVSASAVILAFPELRHEWRKRQIVPAERLDIDDPVQLAETIRSRLLDGDDRNGRPQEAGSHQLLLVSYFAPPTTPVSVNRLRYWQTEIPELAKTRGKSVEVTWLTATRQAQGIPGMLVVGDEGELRVSESAFDSIEDLRIRRLDTLGASWADHVRSYVEGSSQHFDTVVLSGNPFHYFSLAGVMRKAWGCRVLLDFRDPFAWNPRFNYSVEQRSYLMDLEQEMVEDADAIISVNDQCLAQIAPGANRPRHVVANGFDERIVDRARGAVEEQGRVGGPYRVVYSGTVFGNLPLDKVLDAVPHGRGKLVHYGRDYSSSKAVSSHPSGMSGGLLPYEKLVTKLSQADAGLIMTSGESSTQTSKLFDYIACDLDIIIVTDGEVRTGNLHEITRDLARVFWVRNNPEDLRSFFEDYQPEQGSRTQRMEFSRRNQAESLLDLILELERS